MAGEEAHYEKNPAFIFRKIVDEMVLVPVHQDVSRMDCIYTLNGVGAFVWERLDGRPTQAELLAGMTAEYDADPEVIAGDLANFLREMMTIGAIREV